MKKKYEQLWHRTKCRDCRNEIVQIETVEVPEPPLYEYSLLIQCHLCFAEAWERRRRGWIELPRPAAEIQDLFKDEPEPHRKGWRQF